MSEEPTKKSQRDPNVRNMVEEVHLPLIKLIRHVQRRSIECSNLTSTYSSPLLQNAPCQPPAILAGSSYDLAD